MKPSDYYVKLSKEIEAVFNESLNKDSLSADVHDLIINLSDWQKAISSYASSQLINNSIEQIDKSCLLCLQGLYRQSFKSLRLSLEMISASIYFSAYNLEYNEWLNGGYDIKWAVVTDPDNGILSNRFSNAYFPECKELTSSYLTQLKILYRKLSEMVHGNHQTWGLGTKIIYNSELSGNYKNTIKEISNISNFMLCLRFLNEIKERDDDSLDTHLIHNLNHVEQIRTKIGGPS